MSTAMDLKRTPFGHHQQCIAVLIILVIVVSAAELSTPKSATTTTSTMSSNLKHHGLIPILKTKLPPDREPFLLGDLALIEIKRNIIIRDDISINDDVTTTLMINNDNNIGSTTASPSYSSVASMSMLTSISS